MTDGAKLEVSQELQKLVKQNIITQKHVTVYNDIVNVFSVPKNVQVELFYSVGSDTNNNPQRKLTIHYSNTVNTKTYWSLKITAYVAPDSSPYYIAVLFSNTGVDKCITGATSASLLQQVLKIVDFYTVFDITEPE